MRSEDHLSSLRAEASGSPDSGIYDVIAHGGGRQDIVPLWVGEGDLPTPDFIAEAVTRSLQAGETFYTQQLGVPELRAALARYHTRLFARSFSPDRFFVTASGMHAIQLAVRMVAGTGDTVVVPTPSWPNILAAVGIAGAVPVPVPFQFGESGWQLDLDRLFDAVGPRTRAMFINTPANPTGWTASHDEIEAIVSFCDRRGLWIFADEVYQRFYYPDGRPPSFYDHADPDARIMYINTFSKNWAMTGWRVGWLAAPPALSGVMENLVQYSTTGVAVFMQRAATEALDHGEDFVAEQVQRAAAGRKIVTEALSESGRVRFTPPDGAFYQTFAVDGYPDDRALAFQLIDEAAIGVAPGSAFGPGGEGFVRICFARRGDGLVTAMDRLNQWLRT